MIDIVEFYWGNKVFIIENIMSEHLYIPNMNLRLMNQKETVKLTIESKELLQEIRKIKLENILNQRSTIFFQSPIYYSAYDKTGCLIKQVLIKPKKVFLENNIIYITSDFWSEQYV